MSLLTILLLQADAAMKTAAQATNVPAEKISLFHLLMEGGALMIPLLLCSIILVYVFAERLMVIRKASNTDKMFLPRIKEQVEAGNKAGAIGTCKVVNTPLARVIEKGVTKIGRPMEQVERSMENSGKLEVYQLEKNLSILSALSNIAPIFGFLGTIAGMIILFFNVQHEGFSLPAIAGGIYTKMVTSATGLIIGLLAYLGYTYLNTQINKIVNSIEAASVEFLDFIPETNH